MYFDLEGRYGPYSAVTNTQSTAVNADGNLYIAWIGPSTPASSDDLARPRQHLGGVFRVREDEPVPRIGAGLHRTP